MPPTRQRCAGIWMNGINGNPCCHLLLKDGILKHVTEWLIMPMCFLEVILIGVVRCKLLFLLSEQTDTELTQHPTYLYKPIGNTTSLFGNTNFFFFLKSDTWALVRLQVGGSLHNMNANSATDYFIFFSPLHFLISKKWEAEKPS